jgi:hypothetical protein
MFRRKKTDEDDEKMTKMDRHTLEKKKKLNFATHSSTIV